MAGNNNSGGSTGALVIVIICVALLFGSCSGMCSGGKSRTTATEKEKQTAQYMGEHGYFDYGKKYGQ